MTAPGRRLIGVDVGGTFTDVVAVDGTRLIATKVPTDVASSDRSVLAGAKAVDVGRARAFNFASTAGINAIITRNLPKIAFLTTMGHRDILDKGNLWRPFEALTDASWRRTYSDSSRPLVPRYLRRGIVERVSSKGDIVIALDREQAAHELDRARRCGVEGIAICLLHSWVNADHELALREMVTAVFGEEFPCSISSAVAPIAKEYRRASTTVIDLFMKLKYEAYNRRLEIGLNELGFEGELNYADCAAMLLPASYAMERPSRLVVGGPAAGTAASAYFGETIGERNLLCIDVGGTSCDISIVIDGRPWVNDEFQIEWDLVVAALSTEVVTIGAGGGSVVTIGRAGEVLVGPDSAGADPGPAAYGKGGKRPTITDAALLVGILAPGEFLGGQVPLHPRLAWEAFERLESPLTMSERIRYAWLIGLNNVAEGLLDITIRHGVDPRDFVLMAYGAAGPMMLPSLLDLVPAKGVIVPPEPGGFSALGLVSSDRVFTQSCASYGVLDDDMAPRISRLFEEMEAELLERSDAARESVRIVRTFDGRLLRQGWEIPFILAPSGTIRGDQIREMIANFHEQYFVRNGHRFDRLPVEGVTYRVQVIVSSEKVVYATAAKRIDPDSPKHDSVMLHHLYGSDRAASEYSRQDLALADAINGPAIIREERSTTFVPAGRRATVGEYAELRIT